MPETPTAADALADIQDVCYRAIHHAAFNTSDKMLAALAPLIDRAKAAELRRIADRHVTAVFTPDTEWEAAEMHATEKVVAELRARADVLDPPARQED